MKSKCFNGRCPCKCHTKVEEIKANWQKAIDGLNDVSEVEEKEPIQGKEACGIKIPCSYHKTSMVEESTEKECGHEDIMREEGGGVVFVPCNCGKSNS